MLGGASAGLLTTKLDAREWIRLGMQSLRNIADQTGGFAWTDRNVYTPAFQRIVRENSRYYLLTYRPTNAAADGKLRRIDVRSSRRGLRISARRGYIAPRMGETDGRTGPPESPAIMPLAIAWGPASAVDAYRDVVVRTEAEWERLWATLPTAQTKPRIDFSKFMVVGVFRGLGDTPVALTFESARLVSDTLVVRFTEAPPTNRSPTPGGPHRPFALAGFPRFDGPVRFERVSASELDRAVRP